MATAAAVAAADDGPRAPSSFAVVFATCTEFAGLAPVPLASVQGRLPAGYTPASMGAGLAGFVARAARCERVSVDGGPAEPASVSHIGINLVAPDGTGDINNYTLMYVTDSARLAARLRGAGLPVRLDKGLVYEVNPAGAGLRLFAQVDAGRDGVYVLEGPVTDPAAGSEFPFLANWWYGGRAGRVKMSTQIPAIGFGTTDVALLTARASTPGELTGANRTLFPLLSVRGRFAQAVMTVTVAR